MALLCASRCLGDKMKTPCLGIYCVGALFLAGCQDPKTPLMVVPKSDQVEPLWSMKVACTNGLRLDGQKVLLFPRNGSNVEQWTLDVVSGDILEFSDGPTKGEGAPQDSHSALSGGKPRTLNRPEVAPITPSGFEPLVLTDRFLFARRSRLRFSYPHFFHDGEAIVIDRGTGKIIWTQIGSVPSKPGAWSTRTASVTRASSSGTERAAFAKALALTLGGKNKTRIGIAQSTKCLGYLKRLLLKPRASTFLLTGIVFLDGHIKRSPFAIPTP